MPETIRDGCSIWYTVDGPPGRPALLLSNSLGTTVDLWEGLVPALAQRYRVIRYDTRGHGRSDAPGGVYSLETLGRDALAVLDAEGVERAAVCGVSLGGLTALWLGIHMPERVTRLVPANTGAQIGTDALWNERIAGVEASGVGPIVEPLLGIWFTPGFRAQHPETIARFRTMIGSSRSEGYIGCCAAVRDADLRDRLATIERPCLVVVGSRDVATPPSLGHLLRDRIPGARLVTLQAAHLSNVEQPDLFLAALMEFLDE